MLLELKNIHKQYESPSGGESTVVLKDISLQVRQGESIGIVGPSGSGKSTLLNIIGALDRPTSGEVLFAGNRLADLNDNALAKIRNEDIGFVFQLHHLLPQCIVLENVLIPTIPLHISKKESSFQERAEKLLKRVGLEDRMFYFPAQLSGGERQRVAVVRALINAPKLILADEPTGSLDQKTSRGLVQLLTALNEEEGQTLIVVTHSMPLAAQMERIVRLENGLLKAAEEIE
ncbi:MAG: ABC transporter ATP-binding protein [bacterium]